MNMNKLKLGIIIAIAVVIGGVIGYSLVPKLMGAVSYDKQYFQEVSATKLDVSGSSTMKDLTVSGTFTPATLSGFATSSMSSLTVTNATSTNLFATLLRATTITGGSQTLTGTLGVTGTSTLGITNTGAFTGTTGLFSSTFGVTGISTMATTSVTSFCVKNAEGIWTKITFSGVTPSYATSTSCL